ncbi:molybdenum ABC transporter ATP-binding protein [Brucella sp. 10RB9214]|uniref:molybdenum ABC transporter ATP-binding protein n=1 Tax=unclassified Brucella TaxID=2632610 RepID=UPI00097281DA|nr:MULTISPECIES: molybdenum ABC transporter ATP-binding protein [unclassified Brucella]APY15361.1 molybdenum ABC transporter ATP-binding protein [Brucella sp. 09RB8910]MRN46556.1 molybdenum ABC transporter ATP-binding protein [Brucella sp. 10RB9212]MRN50607.1 molybdenum ABC transporter ATP-binding protein [Brucella sp. 10RB9214]
MSGLTVSITGRNGAFAIEAGFAAEGGVTALFGHSGAGKTTLLKMIAGTLRPENGRIAVGDFTLFDAQKGINLPPEKRRIGYVFQDARLFTHMSVKRNLTYARWAGHRQATRSFDEVVALLGIGHLLDRRPSTLSGGERQRVAIGRALLSDPALLLLDEPLSSLDHARRQEILPFIERLRDESHVPIVYVSHEIDEVARLADQIVLLSAGRVTASGAAADIFPLIDAESEGGGVLLEGIVSAYDERYKLAEIDLGGASFQLSDAGLKQTMHVRLRVRARDVSIARKIPEAISIRNLLPVTVTGIERGEGPNAHVFLDFRGRRLGARLTRRSVDDLGLSVGDQVVALVKAVSVDRAAIREK